VQVMHRSPTIKEYDMRVLICHRPGGAFGYISDGWLNALRDRGHDVRRWDGAEPSWREFQPDLYIGCSGHKQPIPAKRNAKVAIHVNPFGPVDISGINETQQNIDWVRNQRPDAVFGYGHEEDRLMWSNWKRRLGIQWVPMPTGGDKVIFNMTRGLDQRDFDVVYLGGRWPYKAQTIDTFLLPIFQFSNLSFKVHGWGDWPDGVCSGILPADQPTQFLNSGRIGPCISEKHTQQYGIDIPERAFKVALCGALIVHDSVPSVKRMIPSAIVARNNQDFIEQCMHYAQNDEERQALVEKQRAEVLAEHTYHHRVATLLRALDFTAEAEDMIDAD
jgi:hypothetical protein